MASFKQAWDLLLYSHCKNRITIEQLPLMLDENISDNPELDYTLYEMLDLQSLQKPSVYQISDLKM